jgi:hypothetical protein
MANALASGAIVNDSATKKVNIVRPMRMDMLDAAGISACGLVGQVTISRAVLGSYLGLNWAGLATIPRLYNWVRSIYISLVFP